MAASNFKLTIKKLNAMLLGVCVLSMSGLAWESHREFRLIKENEHAIEVTNDTLDSTNLLKDAITELTLTCMDIIVDKQEASVSKERQETIKNSLFAVDKNLLLIEKNASTEQDKVAIQRIKDELPKLRTGVEELVTAVVSHAEEGEFARLDDLIDSTAEKIKTEAMVFQENAAKSFKNAELELIATTEEGEAWVYTIIGVLSVVILAIVTLISKALGAPFTDVLHYLEELQQGNDDFDVMHTQRSDEIGTIARRVSALKHTVSEAFSFKQMVENAPNNIMSVDALNDFKISFINASAQHTLRGIEHMLPVKTEHMLGHSFDIFHKHPEHQRKLLANPANLPHRATVNLGKYRMELLVSAIYNKKGTYTGAMLTWVDVTAKDTLATKFEHDVHAVVSSVAAAATQLSMNAQQLTSVIERSHSVAGQAVNASAQTSSNVQSVAAAAEEMSSSVNEISQQIHRTNELVQSSVEKARNADALATTLQSASYKVNGVVKLISDISGQINLLALNATIESARAGDAGKGFAVVASEVKNLANQVDTSLESVASVLKDMDTASTSVAEALSDIQRSISQISEATSNVASAVEEQSATTNDIARNMASAASGTRVVSDSLNEVASTATQASGSSEQMLYATQELSRQAETLNHQVENFMKSLRA
jgi:methyl-accepting chemotaxis protein